MSFVRFSTSFEPAASSICYLQISQNGKVSTPIGANGVSPTSTILACLSGNSKNQVSAAREKLWRNACSTLLIVDAQSVKNTDTAGLKGYGAGKKVSGIKRDIAVDTLVLAHALAVTAANVTDRQGALQAFKRCKGSLGSVQSVLTDADYVGKPFADGVKERLGAHVTMQIAKRDKCTVPRIMPKRWVVERSFAWLDKNRRLWKNCERWLNTSLQFVHLAFVVLLLRRS